MEGIGMFHPVFGKHINDDIIRRTRARGENDPSSCIAVVRVDQKYVTMVVDPQCRFDRDKLISLFGTPDIEIIPKDKVKELFPELNCCIELLFKNEYQIPVYCSQKVLKQPTISFTSQNDGFDYELSSSEFIRLISEKRLRTII